MNPLLEVLCNEINKLKKALTTTGSDYTATVTKVEGDTAYVQMSGSDISDTPVALSINADVGDSVRVRVANGKAWITGNDTLPPSNDKKEVGTKMMKNMSDRDDDIVIDFGKMEFIGNTLVVDSENFKLDEDGNAKFSGTLEAAGGTFNGLLTFLYDSGVTTQTVQIGPNNVTNPIELAWEFGDESSSGGLSATGFYIVSTLAGIRHAAGMQGGYVNVAIGDNETTVGPAYLRVENETKYATFDVDGPHTPSDIRLKDYITVLSPEIAKRLMPVQFRFNGDAKIHYGFIAQDVQKVIPDVVQEGEDGYLSLTYHELIAPLYALVQEQEDRIDRLEIRLKALEDKK